MEAPDALYTALASVIGSSLLFISTLIVGRRDKDDPEVEQEADDLEQDLDLMKALASAWKAEEERRIEAERRLAACEARERSRDKR